MIAKRERGKLERQLVASLTEVCEQAKAEVAGIRLPGKSAAWIAWIKNPPAHIAGR